jgi:hypothetical protein
MPQSQNVPAYLPANRAFVVQLAGGRTADDPFQGRVEHLASGEVTHFASLWQLATFVAQVIGSTADVQEGS